MLMGHPSRPFEDPKTPIGVLPSFELGLDIPGSFYANSDNPDLVFSEVRRSRMFITEESGRNFLQVLD